MRMRKQRPPEALIAEAKATPGGYVYEIVGTFGPSDAVPPTAIRGAWKVDDGGNIVGDFIPNPNFTEPVRRAGSAYRANPCGGQSA